MGLSHDEAERDLTQVVLPRWGWVAAVDEPIPWLVLDDAGRPVEPIRCYLSDFVARGRSPASTRSYAYDLLRWWRWLRVIGIGWDKATSTEVKDFVLWLGSATKRRQASRTVSAATAGTINPITRKRYLDDAYQARTVRHSNAVLRDFYDFWIDRGAGPLINPVPVDRSAQRSNAHHNPLEGFRQEGRITYNPKLPRQNPRALPDERWKDLFAALRSNRDRALLAVTISSAARASEVMGIRGADVDWGEQLVRVHRKGTRAPQWLPVSPEAMVWLRLYLAGLGQPPGTNEPLWWTLRRRDHGDGLRRQPMNYEALRAVFRRVNTVLGTNWTMHDLRHTAALRMSRDPSLTMRDVQTILGHAHLSTTADVYMVEEQAQVIRRVATYLAERERRKQDPPVVAAGYDGDALAILFGEEPQ
jgi:integrase/recombinase XerD